MILPYSNVSGRGCLCVLMKYSLSEVDMFRQNFCNSLPPFSPLLFQSLFFLSLGARVFHQSYWEENMNIFMNSQSLSCQAHCISLLPYLQDNSSLSSPYTCAFEFRESSAQPKLLWMFDLLQELLWGSLAWTGGSSLCILIAFAFVLLCLRKRNWVNETWAPKRLFHASISLNLMSR